MAPEIDRKPIAERGGLHAPPSRARRLLFAGVVVTLLFGAAEGLLRLPQFRAAVPDVDPSGGFRPTRDIFERRDDRLVLRQSGGAFNRVSLAATRAPGSVRIVTIGGSSTFGYPYGNEYSFSRFLEKRLQYAAPGHEIEVANLGGMSFGSHRELGMLPWILGHQPDVLVVYTGHNEFIEREAYDRALSAGHVAVALRDAMSRTRIWAFLDLVTSRLRKRASTSDADPHDLFGLQGRDEGRLFTLEEKTRVAAAFESRIRSMVAQCRAAKVGIVLCTVPSNLRDWKTETLAFAYPPPAERREAFFEHVRGARRALDSNDPAKALAEMDAADRIEDRWAPGAYLRGEIEQAYGRRAEALASFRRARDLDPVPIRATTEINDAIRRVAVSESVPIIDVEAGFEAATPSGVPGRELILDYCHPTAAGHQRIADLLAARLLDGTLPQLPADSVTRLASYEPVGEEPPPPERLSPAVLWWLGSSALRQRDPVLAVHYWKIGLTIDPDEPRTLYQMARYERDAGNYAESRRYAERLARRPGAGSEEQLFLATLDRLEGKVEDARRAFQRIVDREPTNNAAWMELGAMAREAGDLPGARTAFERAAAILPDHLFQAYEALGDVCRDQGDRVCARTAYENVLRITRFHPGAARKLAGLDAQGHATP